MSLTEQNHTTDTHRQLDDELQHSLLHNKVNHSLYGEILFGILSDSANLV